MKFKAEFAFVARQQESQRIRLKYPDRTPIICEILNNLTKNELDKNGFIKKFEKVAFFIC